MSQGTTQKVLSRLDRIDGRLDQTLDIMESLMTSIREMKLEIHEIRTDLGVESYAYQKIEKGPLT